MVKKKKKVTTKKKKTASVAARKSTRGSVTRKCGYCGKIGHNKRSHEKGSGRGLGY